MADPRPVHHDEIGHRRAANRAIGISAVGLALTGGIELALALFTGSVGLLGDALHNLSDVSTSIVVFSGFAVSKKPPSRRYPYGYDRAEDLSGLGVTLVIWASAAFAAFESYHKLVTHRPTTDAGLDPTTSIAHAAQVGAVVERAVRGAVAEVRQVRFRARPAGGAGPQTRETAEAAVP